MPSFFWISAPCLDLPLFVRYSSSLFTTFGVFSGSEGRRIVWFACVLLHLPGPFCFHGPRRRPGRSRRFDLRPAVVVFGGCRAFCFWQTFFCPPSSRTPGMPLEQGSSRRTINNNGVPPWARVLTWGSILLLDRTDDRTMPPSRELSNHQLSHSLDPASIFMIFHPNDRCFVNLYG